MEEPDLPELTTTWIGDFCPASASCKHTLLRASFRIIQKLNTTVKPEDAKPINLIAEKEMALSPQVRCFNLDGLVGEAVECALRESEICPRKPQ